VLARQGEFDDENGAFLSGRTVGDIPLYSIDARIWEQRCVELGRFLGFPVEPKAWRYLGHGMSPIL
jgi:hypothetical protein